MFVLDFRRAMTRRIFLGGFCGPPHTAYEQYLSWQFSMAPDGKINIIYTAETAGN